MRRWMTVAALLMAAGCASPSSVPPAAPVLPPPATPAPAPPAPPAPPADACGAAKVQHLIGRPRSEIPVPVRPDLQRVACTTCPVTLDFHPNRLNFFFDAATGIIREIRCG